MVKTAVAEQLKKWHHSYENHLVKTDSFSIIINVMVSMKHQET